VNLLASDEYWDPHAIAGLLKGFLRELPASILTRELHLRFLAVIGNVYLISCILPAHISVQTLLTLKSASESFLS
jgi:hypothetical protein